MSINNGGIIQQIKYKGGATLERETKSSTKLDMREANSWC